MATATVMGTLTLARPLTASCHSQTSVSSSEKSIAAYSVSGRCFLASDLKTSATQSCRIRLGRKLSSGWNASRSSLMEGTRACPSAARTGNCGVICMSLPAAKWSARSIKAFGMGELEARKLKYPTTGTEALIMGMLTEGTGEAAKFLRANGVTLFGVRDETIKLLGKADMYFFSPEHPPLTEPAVKALDWAKEEHARAGGDGEVTSEYILLGIWAQKESAGAQILTTLGMDDAKFQELANSIKKEAVRS